MSHGEIVELTQNVAGSPFYSPDLAPISRAERKWGLRDIAVLWISMSACIPTYMLASSLIELGMDWRQAVGTIFLANVIVLVPMILNAHAGTRYGISFPVYCRAAYGIHGANVPALLRALVACGWFGIQSWIGGMAIYTMLGVWWPSLHESTKVAALGNVNVAQLGCFLFFWALNMLVVWRGIESIRVLLNIKAPLLILLGLALLAWAYNQAGGFGPMLSQPSKFAAGGERAGEFWTFFFPALTANVSFWATLSLNIPDFSRYAYSQRDQMLGQALGLPTTMGLYSFIGVAVTSATVIIYGHAIWDPVQLLTKFENHAVLVVAMLSLCLATLATNIAANVVSPANDFAHLWPKRISFRIGGLITGLVGIAIQPWRLLENASVYIDKWLIGYSLLLGAIGGVLIADYYFVRRTRLDLAGLYRKDGPYWYAGGFNIVALIATAAGIAPCMPGFFAAAGLVEPDAIAPFWKTLYGYAWFVSFGTAMIVHVGLTAIANQGRAGR
ncbi:MAG: NCS1 family nucleobase:cation symporter-1 [Planctomycetales bacterium]|nr:NCS1 family nucleobase:cation symporter-1 [Planctomycetales bacterium]MBN8626816.1 NCS1 family nucleobase:cation symporter-1 [Planctomycetota bacterium]